MKKKKIQAERVCDYLHRAIKEELYRESPGYLSAYRLEDGDLLICMGQKGRKELRQELHKQNYYDLIHEIFQRMLGEGWELLSPEQLGALTDCYLILGYDLRYPENPDEDGNCDPIIEDDSDIWWFGDYQIYSETEELAHKGYLVLNKA